MASTLLGVGLVFAHVLIVSPVRARLKTPGLVSILGVLIRVIFIVANPAGNSTRLMTISIISDSVRGTVVISQSFLIVRPMPGAFVKISILSKDGSSGLSLP